MPRLLRCDTCHTITKLPDFGGPVESDTTLAAVCDKHKTNGEPHRGFLFTVDQETFNLLDAQETSTKEQDALLEWMHDERNQYKQWAMECFRQHGNPGKKEGCSDCYSTSKGIGPVVGVPVRDRRYICDFCPFVSGVVYPAQREKKGYYK